MLSTQTLLDSVKTPSNRWHYFSEWQSPVGKKLELLTVEIILSINCCIEWSDHLREHLHDRVLFISGLPGVEPMKFSPDELRVHIEKMLANNPSWRVHVTNPSSLVDEENGKATVFTTSTISGWEIDLRRERVTKSLWRRIGGQWKFVEHGFLFGGGITPIEFSTFEAPRAGLD